jgi:hypothetical protein
MQRSLRISLDNGLPLRARRLAEDMVSLVFGGCAGVGQPCQSTADCCPAQSDRFVLTCALNQNTRAYACSYGS